MYMKRFIWGKIGRRERCRRDAGGREEGREEEGREDDRQEGGYTCVLVWSK